MVDAFLVIMQIGFAIGIIYFILNNVKSVLEDAAGLTVDIKWIGLIVFVVVTPLSFMRSIEKFAFTYVFADILIFVTTVTILVYATKYTNDNGWGDGI